MIRYDEALKILEMAAQERGPLPVEKLPLKKALGRVAAERLSSPEPLPAFDNSSMDGYAVFSPDTAEASPERPARLKVLGAVAAGDAPSKARAGGAYEISTGAPLPRGCDAVIRIEDARVLDGGRAVELKAPASPGDYLRRAGSDFRAGTPVLEAGTLLEPRHILVLAALGHDRIKVRRRPRVALISTGRELAQAGRKPGPGQIRNATAAYLSAALAQAGAEAAFHGTVPDEPKDFQRRMKKALAGDPDVVVATGAVSMGRHDFVAEEVKKLGGRTLYHRVAIRPGKPGLAASFPQGPLFFGLPGNPVSTVAGLRFFLLPYLGRLRGEPPEHALRARLEEDAEKPRGLRCFCKARLSAGPEGLSALVLTGQDSFRVRPLLETNAWAILPEEGELVRAGSLVEIVPLWPGPSFHPSPRGQRAAVEALRP